jgi:hypothetical protein
MPMVRTRTARLTQQQIRFLDAYAQCHDGKKAAMSVGYTDSSAPQMAKRTLANPKAIEYLSTLQAESRAIVAYDLALAMKESLEVIQYAKQQGNAMAYFKAVEHRAKLSGLLIDRVQVATVDIKSALEEARQRIVEVLPPLRLPNMTTSDTHAQQNKLSDGGVPGGVGAESVEASSGAGPFAGTGSKLSQPFAPTVSTAPETVLESASEPANS